MKSETWSVYLVLNKLIDSPILYLSNYINKNKSDYYKLFNEFRENNNYEDWIIYILKGIEETSKNTIELIKQIQSEMESYKEGKDFFWSSTNLNDMNFVMYTFPFRDENTFTKAYFIHKRDSVMKVNIPGEREGMYMETADSAFVDVRNIAVKGDYAFEARGLWEMKNDAMGGPFVSHMRVDRANARVVVVEGFVYNPGKLKRDQIRRLNAALYTLKLPSEQAVSELPVDSTLTEEKVEHKAEQTSNK